MWMCHAGVDEHRVTVSRIKLAPVCSVYFNVRVVRQILLSPHGKIGIDFCRHNGSAWTDHFPHDRCVVTDAAPEMIDAVAWLELQSVDPMRECRWLSVVDVARRIKHDDHVVIKMAR